MLLFICLFFTDIFTNNNVDTQLQTIKEENEKISAGIKIKVYTGYSLELATTTDIPINEPEIIYRDIDETKPLVMYIHGYREHPANESIQTVIGGKFINRVSKYTPFWLCKTRGS